MKMLVRYVKFNAVGAIGMVLQLAAFTMLTRWMDGRYLAASAIAVEIAVLHNFAWHMQYTWRDHSGDVRLIRRLARFQLSNGMVSLMGNVVLMRVLVQEARLHLLVADIVAIGCCSSANFWLGHRWVFAEAKKVKMQIRVARVCVAWMVISAIGARAQIPAMPQKAERGGSSSTASFPEAPAPAQDRKVQATSATSYHSRPSDSYLYNAGVFCGAGASTSPAATKPTFGCGAGATFIPLPIFVEVGIMGPQANRSYLSGYISVDDSLPLAPATSKYLPMALVGYSRLFEMGHALDYGVALALPRFKEKRDDSRSLRIELRDYWTFASPPQHNVMLRIGWMVVEND